MRYEYYQIARKFEVAFCQFFIDLDVNEAVGRNESRKVGERVPSDVITKMSEKLERPNPMSNLWERFSFSVKCDQVQLEVCSLTKIIFGWRPTCLLK